LLGKLFSSYFGSQTETTMTIKVELTEAEVKGIKAYLKEVDNIERPCKRDIELFIASLTNAMHSPQEAVSDYIRAEEKKNLPYNVATIHSEI
jgi:hypothetical protein